MIEISLKRHVLFVHFFIISIKLLLLTAFETCRKEREIAKFYLKYTDESR